MAESGKDVRLFKVLTCSMFCVCVAVGVPDPWTGLEPVTLPYNGKSFFAVSVTRRYDTFSVFPIKLPRI